MWPSLGPICVCASDFRQSAFTVVCAALRLDYSQGEINEAPTVYHLNSLCRSCCWRRREPKTQDLSREEMMTDFLSANQKTPEVKLQRTHLVPLLKPVCRRSEGKICLQNKNYVRELMSTLRTFVNIIKRMLGSSCLSPLKLKERNLNSCQNFLIFSCIWRENKDKLMFNSHTYPSTLQFTFGLQRPLLVWYRWCFRWCHVSELAQNHKHTEVFLRKHAA